MRRDVVVRLETTVDHLERAYRGISWLNMEEPYESELAQIRADISLAQQKVLDIRKKLSTQ